MHENWVDVALARLHDFRSCPGCGAPLASTHCQGCGIELADPRAREVATASKAAADALLRRESALAGLRMRAASHAVPAPVPATGAAPSPGAVPGPARTHASALTQPGVAVDPGSIPPDSGHPYTHPGPLLPPVPVRARSTIGLQQVLAAAGAGLLAVAVVVFVFFTLADQLLTRALVTGGVTVVAGAAAVAMRRLRMPSSGEALAALTTVLVLGDVELGLLAGHISGASAWGVRAGMWAAIAAMSLFVGRWVPMRSWISAATLLPPVVPLALVGVVWSSRVDVWVGRTLALALFAATVATLLVLPIARLASNRVGSDLRPEKKLLVIVRLVFFPLGALIGLTTGKLDGLPGLGSSACLMAVAALCAYAVSHTTGSRLWTVAAGASAALASALLGVASMPWSVAVLPALVLLMLVAMGAATRRLDGARRGDLLGGGLMVMVVALVIPGMVWLGSVLHRVGVPREEAPLDFDAPAGGEGALATAALLGITAGLVALLALARLRLVTERAVLVEGKPFGSVREKRAHVTCAIGRYFSPWMALVLLVGIIAHPSWWLDTSVALGALAVAALIATLIRPQLTRKLVGAVGHTSGTGTVTDERTAVGLGRRRLEPFADVELRWWRWAALTGVFGLLAIVAAASWAERTTALAAGGLVVLLVLWSRQVVPVPVRPWLVVLAYGYGLVVLAFGLWWARPEWVVVACVVSAAASVIALAVTMLRRVDRQTWWAVLATTAVPFGVGVATLLVERSWWSVGAAVLMLALEAVLVLTRRDGAAPWLRAGAAWGLLPTMSVALVSAGAMLLPGSGSPVVVPVVAGLTAAMAIAAAPLASWRAGHGLDDQSVRWIRLGVEMSALVTAAIAILLAVVREAVSGQITVAVLCILAAGAGVVALRADRRAVWWLSAAGWVAALWTSLTLAGIGLVEAYTVPMAVVAVFVGVLLAWRAPRWWGLAGAGFVLLIVPSLLVQIAGQSTDWGQERWSGASPVRSWTVIAVSVVALVASVLVGRLAVRVGSAADSDTGGVGGEGRRGAWTRAFAAQLAGVGVLGAVIGAIEALTLAGFEPVRRTSDAGPEATTLFLEAFGWSVLAGCLAGAGGWLAARALRWARVTRWWAAPAIAMVVVGAVPNTGWSTQAVGTLWVVEIALLALAVLVTRRALAGRLDIAPVWFVWLAAMACAIGGWFPRSLRVEVFSLPLGGGLLLVGALGLAAALRTTASRDATKSAGTPGTGAGGSGGVGSGGVARIAMAGRPAMRRAWPVGYLGSWRTLGVGLLATFGPSICATFTNARTWRAVLVILLALICVLVGTRWNLSAPFVLGVAVLPVEIIVVFATQLGKDISTGPWMLTLTAAGGLLIIIATYYERRIAAHGGAAAYVRDLR